MFIKAIFSILAFIFSFLQATILPINFVFLLVILVAIYQPDFSFLFAFSAGLTLDLIKGESLGITSIKFLLIAFSIFLLKIRLPIREKRQLKLPQI